MNKTEREKMRERIGDQSPELLAWLDEMRVEFDARLEFLSLPDGSKWGEPMEGFKQQEIAAEQIGRMVE